MSKNIRQFTNIFLRDVASVKLKWWERIERLAKRPQIQSGLRLLFLIFLVSVLLVLGFSIESFDSEFTNRINELDIDYVGSAWESYEADEDRIILSMTLPDEVPEDFMLAFETDHQTLTVMVGDELLYDRTPDNPWYLGREIGRVWNFIGISHHMSGQDIVLDIDNYAGMRIYSATAMLGSSRSIYRNLLMDVMPLIIYVAISSFLGFILFLLAFGIGQGGMKSTSRGVASLSFALIFLSVLMASNSYIAQFVNMNLALAYLIAQIFYLVLPILFMQYLRDKISRGQSILDLLSFFQLFFLTLILFLHFHGIKLIVEQQGQIRILLLFYLLTTAVLSIDSLRRHKIEAIRPIPLIAVLFVDLVVIVLVIAYNLGRRNFDLFFFVWVIETSFLSMLTYDMIKRTMKVFISAAEARGLKKIAYQDSLTGLFNRSAFDRDIAEVNLHMDDYHKLGALALDLNNLKQTNDHYGHFEGDFLIVSVARLIDDCFSKHGRAYRFGGDEFIVLLNDKAVAEIDNLLETFTEMIDKYNAKHELPIKISWGFAGMTVQEDIPSDVLIQRILKTADERMYLAKKAQANASVSP